MAAEIAYQAAHLATGHGFLNLSDPPHRSPLWSKQGGIAENRSGLLQVVFVLLPFSRPRVSLVDFDFLLLLFPLFFTSRVHHVPGGAPEAKPLAVRHQDYPTDVAAGQEQAAIMDHERQDAHAHRRVRRPGEFGMFGCWS